MRLLFSILFLFNFYLSFSQPSENEDTIIKRNNIVKETVVYFRYKYNNAIDYMSNSQHEIYYNNFGKAIEMKVANKDGTFITRQSLFYNERNLLAKSIILNDLNKPTFTVIFDYDSAGNITSMYSFGYRGNGPPNDTVKINSRTKKSYNSKNQLMESFYNSDGSDSIYHKNLQYVYNSDGKIDKELYFDKNGDLNFVLLYEYKKDNRYIQKLKQNKSEKPEKYIELFYNKNRQIEKRIFYLINSISTTTYSYNDDGTISEKAMTNNGIKTSFERHLYTKQ